MLAPSQKMIWKLKRSTTRLLSLDWSGLTWISVLILHSSFHVLSIIPIYPLYTLPPNLECRALAKIHLKGAEGGWSMMPHLLITLRHMMPESKLPKGGYIGDHIEDSFRAY